MIIYIGADHRGFKLKEFLKKFLFDKGYEVVDVGASVEVVDDDYPDYAGQVAQKVSGDPTAGKGILICGSGFGVDIVANKFKGVRSALPMSPDHAYQARHDDDVNVLSLSADFIPEEAEAAKIVQVFLSTPFAKEAKYSRRLTKISAIEDSM
ncbi:MAG: RpiB/LacA/LacB family sugar-phosphate isomerase [Candidatus Liptonbacteria bacterium]|nr:RpiB/LacA/LacB family sugar-phosphate isomerase [Candidatus Liptonbacteria bacterium]